MEATAFKTVFAGVRPARVATFLDRNDPDWEHTCLRIIQFYCSVWGGKYNIVVPTDGTAILPAFWKALDLYDPDYCFSYVKTGRDLKICLPAKYEELLRQQTEREASQVDATQGEALRADLDRAMQDAAISNFGITNELEAKLAKRLAVFHLENHAIQSQIYASSDGVWQLTKIAKILPHCDHGDKIATVESVPLGLPPLWLAAVTGSYNSAAIQELTAAGLRKAPIQFPRLDDVIRLGVRGYYDSDYVKWVLMAKGEKDPVIDDPSPYFPFEMSMTHLGMYRSMTPEIWNQPAFVIVGDTVDDFAFYFLLSRLRPHVAWLPGS